MYKMAWRNLWRNRRRTLITLTTIAVTVLLLSFMMSLQEGTYERSRENTIRVWHGHLRVFATGYWDQPSLNRSFLLTPYLVQFFNDLQTPWAERIDGFGLVSLGEKTYGTSISGVNPRREPATIRTRLVAGRFLEGPGEAVVGADLADNLDAREGDRLALLVQGRDGSLGAQLFTVVGRFKTHMPDLDRTRILIPRADADRLFSMDGRVTTVAIFLPRSDARTVQRFLTRLRRRLPAPRFEVRTWKDLLPELEQIIQLDRTSGYAYYFILVIIVGFGLLNTIYMSVFERRKEFAVLRAIGMDRGTILRLIAIESFYLGSLGALLGFALATPLIFYFARHPIQIGGRMAEIYETFGFEPTLVTLFSPRVMLSLAVLVVGASWLLALFPGRRVVREDLATQLKFEK